MIRCLFSNAICVKVYNILIIRYDFSDFSCWGTNEGQKMEAISKENTNTIAFLKNVIKEPIKSPLSLMF